MKTDNKTDYFETLCSLTDDEKEAERMSERLSSIEENIEEEAELEVDVLKAMAEETRLKILKMLTEGEFCVCEIIAALKRPQSTISHHLSILRKAGLVKSRKEGKWNYYRISDGAVIQMLNLVDILVEK